MNIMGTLQDYAPTVHGQMLTVPTHGDGMSIERMVDAKRARSSHHTSAERLDGLEPTPQEFHHRGLMLQVSVMDLNCDFSSKPQYIYIRRKSSFSFIVGVNNLNIICSWNEMDRWDRGPES